MYLEVSAVSVDGDGLRGGEGGGMGNARGKTAEELGEVLEETLLGEHHSGSRVEVDERTRDPTDAADAHVEVQTVPHLNRLSTQVPDPLRYTSVPLGRGILKLGSRPVA